MLCNVTTSVPTIFHDSNLYNWKNLEEHDPGLHNAILIPTQIKNKFLIKPQALPLTEVIFCKTLDQYLFDLDRKQPIRWFESKNFKYLFLNYTLISHLFYFI